MASTKYRIAEQSALIINGGTPQPDTQVQVQDLILASGQAMAKVVALNFFVGMKDGERGIDGSLIYTYEAELKRDARRNRMYFEMPSSYIGTLPHEMGVWQVSWLDGEDFPFVNIGNGGIGVFSGTQAENMGGHEQFWVESDRGLMKNRDCGQEGKPVLLKLACALEGIDMDTMINIPADMEMDIVNMCVQIYREQQDRPQDNIDDNEKLANKTIAR